LLVTGAGRCNITNLNVSPERFTCNDPSFIPSVLALVSPARLREELARLGILTYATADGWCYPLSESAQAVVDLLHASLISRKVKIHFPTRIHSIEKSSNGFLLHADSQEFHTPVLIVTAGGRSFPRLGSTGELFPSLQNLGHTVLPLRPALAAVLADMHSYLQLQGVRLNAAVSLFEGRNLLAQTFGNLIFTSWGLNGPAVMDLSHHISARPETDLHLELDLLHDHKPQMLALFESLPTIPLATLLEAVLPPKVPPVILELCKLSPKSAYANLSPKEREVLLARLTRLPFAVKGVRGFEFCQLKSGGVPVSEIDSASMKSRLVHNLFLAGETLDVVGACGGNNLHFALGSGMLAGTSAGS